MGRTIEEVDRDIWDAVDANDVQWHKRLVAEKTELLAGIGVHERQCYHVSYPETQPVQAVRVHWKALLFTGNLCTSTWVLLPSCFYLEY
jgi:hypothetical protein